MFEIIISVALYVGALVLSELKADEVNYRTE